MRSCCWRVRWELSADITDPLLYLFQFFRILMHKWHQLFTQQECTDEIRDMECELNGLLMQLPVTDLHRLQHQPVIELDDLPGQLQHLLVAFLEEEGGPQAGERDDESSAVFLYA